MTDKIAAECCGSCMSIYESDGCTECDVDHCYVNFYDDDDCEHYTPRNPIDNPYKKYKDLIDKLSGIVEKENKDGFK